MRLTGCPGRIALKIPKPRKGSHFPSFLEPRRTAEKALVVFAIVFRTNGVPMAHSRRPASTGCGTAVAHRGGCGSREKQPRLGALMDASRDDVLACMSFPASTGPGSRQ